MSKILVLGGTGAMGVPLIRELSSRGDEVTVTSRRERKPEADNVRYLRGNAKDLSFIKSVTEQNDYDAIVDFMSYRTAEFKERYKMMLSHTGQYIFISSARVFAESPQPLREDSPRLLDVCKDEEYLLSDEYALAKAREEDLLRASNAGNWTIVRPSITYNDYRLQLGAFDKEGWLYRALHGRSIVMSDDVADKKTAMTHGHDVARGIAAVTGEQKALQRAFNIASNVSLTWKEILEIYLSAFDEVMGKRPRVVIGKTTVKMKDRGARYQILYARSLNRSFDNSAIGEFVDTRSFVHPKEGVKTALAHFLKAPVFGNINWRYEAWNDIEAGEHTPLSEIPSRRSKIEYLCLRHHLPLALKVINKIIR